ncbi:MAG: hypothetical protein JKY42_07710, partial [Flavobacteriales bacterium]|nr:hypothetical protein [Flavobacteriales bacterium]
MKLLKIGFSFLLVFQTLQSFSQITITDADMSSVNDVVIESVVPLNSLDTIDPSLTGVNYTWDFCHLSIDNQRVDTFISVSSTPLTYQFYFNNAFLYPGYDASYAKRGQEINFNQAGIGVSITDVYDYFKNDASDYKQVGFGANINGIPASIQYDGIDYIYRFPMNYGNIDSSNAAFVVDVPTLGTYGQKIDRRNEVDGWGEITTPFGTYDALRVRTTLTITDTVYLTLANFGTTIPRPAEYVYTWLANGEGIPIMTVTTREIVGVETVTGASFKDVLG